MNDDSAQLLIVWLILNSDVNKTKFLRPRPEQQDQDQDQSIQDRD